jgi:small-conductance mechanosensitive channel
MSHRLEEFSIMQLAVPFVMSAWGCVAAYVNYLLRYRRRFSWAGFTLRALISCFAGIIAFAIADSLNLGELERASVAGMAGWLGPETFSILKSYFGLREIRQRNKS